MVFCGYFVLTYYNIAYPAASGSSSISWETKNEKRSTRWNHSESSFDSGVSEKVLVSLHSSKAARWKMHFVTEIRWDLFNGARNCWGILLHSHHIFFAQRWTGLSLHQVIKMIMFWTDNKTKSWTIGYFIGFFFFHSLLQSWRLVTSIFNFQNCSSHIWVS